MYTKGKWKVDSSTATIRIRDSRGFCIATLYHSGTLSPAFIKQNKADAQLIAQSPRMAEWIAKIITQGVLFPEDRAEAKEILKAIT